MKWLFDLSSSRHSALMGLLLAFMACVGVYFNMSPAMPDNFEDNPIEEYLEDHIEEKLGLEIDFSKDSPE